MKFTGVLNYDVNDFNDGLLWDYRHSRKPPSFRRKPESRGGWGSFPSFPIMRIIVQMRCCGGVN